MIYIDLIWVALITIYIVDLSGFTESWREGLARMLHVKTLRPLKPFDCGQCMTWWVCLAFLLMSAKLTLPLVAFSALLSFLSVPLGQILLLIRETLTKITNTLFDKVQ